MVFVVGSLGFEPRIANAPGWYTKPLQPPYAQYNHQTELKAVAIRRPLEPEVRYQDEINKTLDRAANEGKAHNTVKSFRNRLRELSKIADLNNPNEVKTAIAHAPLSNSSKTSFCLAYEWYTKTNGLQWQKPKYKWTLGTPIIPTTDQVNKTISAPRSSLPPYSN